MFNSNNYGNSIMSGMNSGGLAILGGTGGGNSSMFNGSGWGSTFGGALQGFSGVMSGLAGIGQVWNAYQANKLAREQFAFEKSAYKTNLANQAKMINNSYDSAANVSAQLGGTTPGNSLASSKAIADYKKKAESNHVSGTMQ